MVTRIFVALSIIFAIIPISNALEFSNQDRLAPQGPRNQIEYEVEEVLRYLKPRIVGGSPAQIGSYQYYGAMNRFPPGCGASLVSPQFMITAAHCVENFIEMLYYLLN